MTKVIGVRFRPAGKIYFFAPGKLKIKTGDKVIVETARGVEYGSVVVGEKEVEDDKINNLNVIGGCHGNLQGISALLKGMPIDEAIEKLEGIRCHNKPTSCPDQIAKALKAYKKA